MEQKPGRPRQFSNPIIWLITKHMMHACGVQSPGGENQTASLFMGRDIKEAKQSSQCLCLCRAAKQRGLWVTFLSWDHWGTSLPLWSSGLSHTHTHTQIYSKYTRTACLCQAMDASTSFKSDDIIGRLPRLSDVRADWRTAKCTRGWAGAESRGCRNDAAVARTTFARSLLETENPGEKRMK